MKLLIILSLLSIILGCKDVPKEQYTVESTYDIQNEDSILVNNNEQEPLSWKEETAGNIYFKTPENLNFKPNLSNDLNKIYTNEEELIGITINMANLPYTHINSSLKDIIPNLETFGKMINEDNKNMFDDCKLVSCKYSNLGELKSVEVIQTSTKISDSNTPMFMDTYVIISYPLYYSIIFSYPQNSKSKNTIEDVKKSFKFNANSLPKSSLNKSTNEAVSNLNNKQENPEFINSINKRYLGKHLFNAYFLDEYNSFGSVTITRSNDDFRIIGEHRNKKNEYVKIDGLIKDYSLNEFTFVGTISTYNPTSIKKFNSYSNKEALKDECIWYGTSKFEKIFENRNYWRMRGNTDCDKYTGSIDVFFNY